MLFTFGSNSSKQARSQPVARHTHPEPTSRLYVHALSISHKIAVGTLALSSSSIAFVGLYMVKSAVGIDLFPGPSFMHDSFYVY